MEFQAFLFVTLAATVVLAAVLAYAAREFRSARPWVVLTALSVATLPAGIVLHNLISALIGGEEVVAFLVALLVAPVGIAVGTIGAGRAIARAESERLVVPREGGLGFSVLVAGVGMALFGGYSLFALVVTTIEGGNPPYQAPIEAVMLTTAALAMIVGAALALATARRTVHAHRAGTPA